MISVVTYDKYLWPPLWYVGVVLVRGLAHGARVAHALVIVGGKLSF